jgi:hypothetical protein
LAFAGLSYPDACAATRLVNPSHGCIERRSGDRLVEGGAVRVMLMIWGAVIVGGLIYFTLIGLIGR